MDGGSTGTRRRNRAQRISSPAAVRKWTAGAYIKGANTDAGDEFGSAIALSGDGHMMVVGAHQEDGGARGINGNQADNSASDSGAAYVFAY